VALGALFPCAAVTAELLRAGGVEARFEDLVGRVRQMEEAVAGSDWEQLTPAEAMRSGILLLRSTRSGVRAAGVDDLRRHFQAQSIARRPIEAESSASQPPRGCSWQRISTGCAPLSGRVRES